MQTVVIKMMQSLIFVQCNYPFKLYIPAYNDIPTTCALVY